MNGDKTEHSQRGKLLDAYERVMPQGRTITGAPTDKPQFPSRMDGMDRATVTKVLKHKR